MKSESVTCIGCPLGCSITVEMSENGDINAVYGNTCPKGDSYARKEVTSPVRMVTSVVRIEKGELPVVSVKTQTDIPKEKIFVCMEELKKIILKAPVQIGDIAVKDICGTGVPVIVTKQVKAL